MIENCGSFSRLASAGCVCLLFPMENIQGVVSLKVRQLDVVCDTKTKDNVFVKVSVAVQYCVVSEKVSQAFYKLTDHRAQIRAYVFDGIRSSLPKLDLDAAYASKDEIAESVQGSLASLMSEYGYEIKNVLVIDLEPDAAVKAAMNEINAAQRLRQANAYKADADKILRVKAAEADSESKHLLGIGIARQRKALVDGLRDTVSGFSSDVEGTGPQDVMDLLLLTQYFDMMKELGQRGSGNNTVFLPHGPDSVAQLRADLKKNFAKGMRSD